MKKKLQVFVSSTYLDLQSERQAAVQAVLDAGHIPAGMELFRAGNVSQLATIKKWIDSSDIYMLILGGRYGSVDEKTGKSYTQIEYDYANKKGIPIFAVVLTDSYLHSKAAQKQAVFEKDNVSQYNDFKKLVMSKLIKHVEDEKDIKLAIHGTLSDFLDEYDLVGWVRSSDADHTTELINENVALNKEKASLYKEKSEMQSEINKLKERIYNADDVMIGSVYFKQMLVKFRNKIIFNNQSALDIFLQDYYEYYQGAEFDEKYERHVILYLLSFGLLERSYSSSSPYKYRLSDHGMKFYRHLEMTGITEDNFDILLHQM